MSDLALGEKLELERVLEMQWGFVLGFSNRTFDEFVFDSVRVDIRDDAFAVQGDSKAKRLREFWRQQPNTIVAKLLEDFYRHWHHIRGDASDVPPQVLLDIAARLRSDAEGADAEALASIAQEEDFRGLVEQAVDAVRAGRPEAALDRLHTYMVHFFRRLLDAHDLGHDYDTSLHSLAGTYVRHLRNEELLQSEMASRILRNSISIWDAFNQVRNNHSYAHPNTPLERVESELIVNYVVNTVRFIDRLEAQLVAQAPADEGESASPFDVRLEDDLPF